MNVVPCSEEQCQILRMAIGITKCISQQESGCQFAKGFILSRARYMIADSSCDPLPSRLVFRGWAKPQQSAEVLHTPQRMALVINIKTMDDQRVAIE